MNQSKHTPGPWYTTIKLAPIDHPIYNVAGELVARIPNHPDAPSKADARLIAAAPELLAACKGLAAAAARIVEDDDQPTLVHMRELNRQRQAARDALAKAEGR